MAINLEYEFPQVVRTVLRNRMTDHNSNRVGSYQVFLDYPNPANPISKNSFPRLIIEAFDPVGEVMDVAENFMYTNRVRIRLEVWDRKGDELILTINSVKYSGKKLLDFFAKEARNALALNQDDFHTANYVFHTPNIIPGIMSTRDPKNHSILFRTFDYQMDGENINS